MIIDDITADPMDETIFPADPWRLIETEWSVDRMGQSETLFAVANGYLGMRGVPEEGRDAHRIGTFVNGFHETWEIKHAEEAFGFAKTGQTIVNIPSSTNIKLYVDDEPLLITVADLPEYERSIDFRDGILRRHVVWRTPSGKRVQVDSTRMVSFADRHLAVMTYEVTMLDGDAPITLSSQIVNVEDFDELQHAPRTSQQGEGPSQDRIDDPRQTRGFDHRVLEPQMNWHSDRRMILGFRTANSGMTLAVGADHVIETENEYESLVDTSDDLGRNVYRVHAKQGQPIKVTKAVAYHTSRGVPVRELSDRVRRTLDRVRELGVEYHVDAHKQFLGEFWANADVELGAEPRVQQAVHWCLFQLAQAAGRADGTGIAAKGLTGDGYEGHYFWDSEVYVLPFLSYTNPIWARNALRYRFTHLDHARDRAKELSVKGALFPWRTINGEEASAYYAAGTAQYHIDADVAFSVGRYWSATEDKEFLYDEGAQLLVETARMWVDLGFWRLGDENVFEIHGVTGPDEYTTVVNNNTFTNVMAQHNLRLAYTLLEEMQREAPEQYQQLVKHTDLEAAEIVEWRRCAEGMLIPFDEALGIHPQDDAFLQKELWDLENTPRDSFPLLLHYHPLVIYRRQVLKQADVVLADFLRSSEFTLEQKRADFEYYDPITTGDSSLSAVVQAIVAAEVGHQDMAYRYFRQGLFVDLANLHNNVADGVHIASIGGVWHALVHGFAGMRDEGGVFEFDPRLPRQWSHLNFALHRGKNRLKVRLETNQISFEIEHGEQVQVAVRGVDYLVKAGEPTTVPLNGQGVRLPNLATTHPIIGGRRADGTLITADVPDSIDEMLDRNN